MEFTAILVKQVGLREGDGQNGHWKIASYLLETVEMYPKRMVVDVSDGQMARVAQWDGMVGKNVTIQFDIEAREWKGKWFNSLRAWGIKENMAGKSAAEAAGQQGQAGVATQQTGQQPAGEPAGTAATTAQVAAGGESGDDLPF